jgi:hypothetical protein
METKLLEKNEKVLLERELGNLIEITLRLEAELETVVDKS